MFNEDKKVLDKKSSEKEILKNRQENVKPVLDDFWKHLENIAPVPGSHLEGAVKYAANHKAELCLFADSGKLESTNNRAERAVKPFVMARKNFLFADTERGAEASARIFSLIETAKMNDLYAYGYLLYLLTELPKLGAEPSEEQIQCFLPWSDTLPDYCRNMSNKEENQ